MLTGLVLSRNHHVTCFECRTRRISAPSFDLQLPTSHALLAILDTINSTMAIHIYTEHLINIRTLTIQVSLPIKSDGGTALALSADGSIFTLAHQGETVTVTLPVSVPDSERVKLSVPSIPSRNLSFRVRPADNGSPSPQGSETVIPWTAASLSQQSELQCRQCHAEILPRDAIRTWKDLPSEGWAEMMEFWHCHKPSEPHDHEHQTDKKGYSADSMLAITPSIGLVNATSFVLAADDCKNIKVGHTISFFSFLEDMTTWALKRTGAFQPQGYQQWKIRDIAALEETFFFSQREASCNPRESYGFSGRAMLILLANSSARRRAHWRGVYQRIDT